MCAQPLVQNLDKLLHYVNLDGRVNVLYSTPEAYVAAKHKYNVTWPVKADDDFFPYADCPHCYWAGYYSSRPTHKGAIRAASAYLAAARQLQATACVANVCKNTGKTQMSSWNGQDPLDALDDAVALMQHHDAITGTAKQHVANDYAMRLAAGTENLSFFSNYIHEWMVQSQHKHASFHHLCKIQHPPQIRIFAGLTEAETMVNTLLSQNATAVNGTHTELHTCRLANVSVCAASVAATRFCRPLRVVVYNPLPHAYTAARLLLPAATGACDWALLGMGGI